MARLIQEEPATDADPAAADAPQADIAGQPDQPETSVSYWKWVGMGRAKSGRGKPRDGARSPRSRGRQNRSQGRDRKAAPVLATGSGAFAELAALKESMKK